MKVVSITVCKNEAHIMPFFLRNYERFVDEMVFFDNGSTDGTLELIRAHPKTRIIPFSTLGYQREEIVNFIRNNAYQELSLGADWYIMVDADEILWHQDMRGYLERCQRQGITLPHTLGFNMYAEAIPEDDGKSQIYELINRGFLEGSFSKYALVHKSVKVNYSWGAHTCSPRGNVRFAELAECRLFHYNAAQIGIGLKGRDYFSTRNKRFYWLTNDLINRNLSRETRGSREFTRKEELTYALPVFREPLQALLADAETKTKQGDPEAAHIVGLAHMLNQGRPRNYPLAMDMFEIAAKSGNIYAMYHLGFAYAYGIGRKIDYKVAAGWFEQAAEGGHMHAQNELIPYYNQKKDFERALKMMMASAEQGCVEAMNNLSAACVDEKYGLNDPNLAHQWRVKAAQYSATAMFNEGVYHYKRKDFEQAFIWFERAANRGVKEAYRMIDMLLEKRLGIPDNLENSIERFQSHLTRKIYDYQGIPEDAPKES